MPSLLEKVLTNEDNAKVLRFLGLGPSSDVARFGPWSTEGSGFDEGGGVFFEDYGKHLPETVKYCLDIHNVMVNEENGRIFAVHFGRFTFIFRCDFSRAGVANTDRLRVGYTLDDAIDIRELGDAWALLNHFHEDEAEQLVWAYALSSR